MRQAFAIQQPLRAVGPVNVGASPTNVEKTIGAGQSHVRAALPYTLTASDRDMFVGYSSGTTYHCNSSIHGRSGNETFSVRYNNRFVTAKKITATIRYRHHPHRKTHRR